MTDVTNEPGIEIRLNSDAWIDIPTTWPYEGSATPRAWSKSESKVRTPGPFRRLRPWLQQTLQMLAETTAEGESRFLYLPQVDGPFTLVALEYAAATGDREEALRRGVGMDDPDAVEPPALVEVSFPDLGTGYRALRYHREPQVGALIGHLAYAFRVGPVDLRISCSDPDLDRLEMLEPVVDEFVAAIRVA